MFVRQRDGELLRRERTAAHALDIHAHLRQRRDGCSARAQRIDGSAGVEERGDQHVAGRTGECVDDEALLQRAVSLSMRAASSRAFATMMAAAQRAPKPLSMLTTVPPAAQLVIMESSAASPPKLAPYPTLVGTATTGARDIAPTTLASAPSMPATTTTASAASIMDWYAIRRWMPATPTS